MRELPTDLAAPGPGVVPTAPDVAVAYTDFRRGNASCSGPPDDFETA